MKQYRLLKDLPGLEKGSILSEGKSLFGARTLITKNDVGPIFIGNDLTEEIFEEIKEPTDSIHWEPQPGDTYWFVDCWGVVYYAKWNNTIADAYNFDSGNTYRTEEECEKARERRLAKVRLQRTSDFKPDFENGEGGWTVFFSYMHKELHPIRESYSDSGEPVRYATEEEAKKSIKENREDWKIYFGINPSDTDKS